jgi:hypothetical protein
MGVTGIEEGASVMSVGVGETTDGEAVGAGTSTVLVEVEGSTNGEGDKAGAARLLQAASSVNITRMNRRMRCII